MNSIRLTIIVGLIVFVGIMFVMKNSEKFGNPTTLFSTIGVVKSDLAYLWRANNCDKLWAELYPTGPTEETSPEDGERYGQCVVVKQMQTTDVPNIVSIIGTPAK